MASDFSERLRQYREAVYEALASPPGVVRGQDPLRRLGRLAQDGLAIVAGEQPAAGALAALQSIATRPDLDAAVSEAAAVFESPQRFRELLYFALCLEREPEPALSLLHARLFLEGAAAPAALYPGLAAEQATLLDTTTFSLLWSGPSRHGWMLDAIDVWRSEYTPAYTARHGEFSASVDAVASEIEELAGQAHAMEQLNGLPLLGPPLALAALSQFRELEHLFACSIDSGVLSEALSRQPACPLCSYRLGEEAPVAEVRRARQAIERALSTQLSRLQRAVTRLAARPSPLLTDRLARFVQVVQSGDASGLALLLDDGMVEFLRDLLESPAPRLNLMDQLARDFPEVTNANAPEVIETFRRLIESELARRGGRFYMGREDADA